MKVVLFDTHSLFFRAFYALPAMCTSRGEPTSALYGFSTLVLKTLREEKPDALAFAHDMPQPTFRHESYPEYKAGRPRAPSELVQQLGRLDGLIDAFSLPFVGVPGFEADDVLATMARMARARGDDVLIVSGDHDLFQLVDAHTHVLFLGQRGKPAVRYDEARIAERYGFPAARLASYAALVGDTSDNLPKVRGVGEATAKALLAEHADVEALLASAASLKSPKLRGVLVEHAEQLRRTERLARLREDVPLPAGSAPRAFEVHARERVRAEFEALEFKSLVARLDALPARIGAA